MSTKVFISWSGELSKQVAALLKKWLPTIIQELDPFFSQKDVSKGGRAMEDIINAMKQSKVAISCLTKGNQEKPWIEYEGGFLDGCKVPVCGFLINLTDKEVSYPLKQFQLTAFDKEDILDLLKTINKKCENTIEASLLEEIFETRWPSFEKEFKSIIENTPDEISLHQKIEMLQNELETEKNKNKKLSEKNKKLDNEIKKYRGNDKAIRIAEFILPPGPAYSPEPSVKEITIKDINFKQTGNSKWGGIRNSKWGGIGNSKRGQMPF